MTPPLLAVLRPEPGNAATVARARAAGFEVMSLPLFAIRPLAWTPPDPAAHDVLIVTSANALRFGGAGLDALRTLPVLVVGERSAAAARAAGFTVTMTGASDAAGLRTIAESAGIARALHLTGRDRTLEAGGVIATVLPVYESVALEMEARDLARLRGATALLHSARAARRLGGLLDAAGIARADIALGAFSSAIATAAGSGWRSVAVAGSPDDAALFATIAQAPAR